MIPSIQKAQDAFGTTGAALHAHCQSRRAERWTFLASCNIETSYKITIQRNFFKLYLTLYQNKLQYLQQFSLYQIV